MFHKSKAQKDATLVYRKYTRKRLKEKKKTKKNIKTAKNPKQTIKTQTDQKLHNKEHCNQQKIPALEILGLDSNY